MSAPLSRRGDALSRQEAIVFDLLQSAPATSDAVADAVWGHDYPDGWAGCVRVLMSYIRGKTGATITFRGGLYFMTDAGDGKPIKAPRFAPWTDEMKDCLRRMWGTHTLSAIAAELHRSPCTISQRARDLGLPRKTTQPCAIHNVVSVTPEASAIPPSAAALRLAAFDPVVARAVRHRLGLPSEAA